MAEESFLAELCDPGSPLGSWAGPSAPPEGGEPAGRGPPPTEPISPGSLAPACAAAACSPDTEHLAPASPTAVWQPGTPALGSLTPVCAAAACSPTTPSPECLAPAGPAAATPPSAVGGASERVRVFARVRPLLEGEGPSSVRCAERAVSVEALHRSSDFSFDGVFPPDTSASPRLPYLALLTHARRPSHGVRYHRSSPPC